MNGCPSIYLVPVSALVDVMSTLIELDVSLFYLINHDMANPLLDWVMPWATHIGSILFWAVLSIILWFKGKHRLSVMLAMGLLIEGPLSWGLKNFFRRERPFLNHPTRILENESGFSFPSAHSQRTLLSGVIICGIYPENKVSLMIISLIVAFSRIYIGVHYPLDVTVGALNGMLIAQLIIRSDKPIDMILSSLYLSWDRLKDLFPMLERIGDKLSG